MIVVGIGWKIEDRSTQFKGRLFSVEKLIVEIRGERVEIDVIDHPGSVVVLPIDRDSVVMVRQFRLPTGEWLLELPAGTLEEGEDPRKCAARELKEETGYEAGTIVKLGEFYASPGYTRELLHAYLATDLTRGEQELEADEAIEVVRVTWGSLAKWIEEGRIRDSKTLATLMLYQSKFKHSPPPRH